MVLMVARVVLRELFFHLVGRGFDTDGLVLDAAETFAAKVHHARLAPIAFVTAGSQHFAGKARTHLKNIPGAA